MQRYVGALSEDFQGKVSAIAEQFGGLNRRLDELDERMEERFTKVNKTLSAHTEMIGNLAEDVTIIKANVALLKSAVATKVDYKDFSALEKRVRIIETKLHP